MEPDMHSVSKPKNPEPEHVMSDCLHCGNAPVNHKSAYLRSILSINVDPNINRVSRHAPQFLKKALDLLPAFVLPLFSFFGLAKFSGDIEKVVSFRSRVIWEEAIRRGIHMQQIIIFGKPLESYRAKIKGRYIYFESLPVPSKFLGMVDLWDDKFNLKRIFIKNDIPVPKHAVLSSFRNINFDVEGKFFKKMEKIFNDFPKPLIVKPRAGSRGRHTTTNINSFLDYQKGILVGKQISPYLIIEEHLEGDVCRATTVNGKLAGFFRSPALFVIGDGVKSIKNLIEEKNKNKPERVGDILISNEIKEYVGRSGFALNSVPKEGKRIHLSYRTGRLFGGATKEMIDDLHPSFIPILEKAARTVDIGVAGFDCIIPDPELDAGDQKWGIIECNTLPFIDLHYYALEGKPRNIAGMIWDLWG